MQLIFNTLVLVRVLGERGKAIMQHSCVIINYSLCLTVYL